MGRYRNIDLAMQTMQITSIIKGSKFSMPGKDINKLAEPKGWGF